MLSAKALSSNLGVCSVGFQLTGKGFLLSPATAQHFRDTDIKNSDVLKPWIGGLGIQRKAEAMVAIDVCGIEEATIRQKYPAIYQHLVDSVLPERAQNARKSVRDNWWVYGEARNTFRPAIKGLKTLVVSSLTASHRTFVYVPSSAIADSTTVMFAIEDASSLAVLSSRTHVVWSLAQGGTLEDRPRYNKSRCFDPFPFPELTETQKVLLRTLGEDLDAHRKRQQAVHPKLTLTQMYNVLEKLRAGEAIEGKDKEIYDQGLIGILRDLHDQIDAAVADAYGWPVDLSDEEILMRLVDLNKTRAAEEASGHIRWLRPEYQNPTGAKAEKGKTTDMDLGVVAKVEKAPWPKGLPDQIAAVREALLEMGEASPEQIARRFARARTTAVQPLLESLAALGQAQLTEDGRYAA
ncbi:type IIL restriction-modification enzyme MmeI [Roseibium algae]|uniref:site-specific DNA-methyltransferase (adenine-specific) n=1 Tax=Roseibium algae TaxID=3123038 RepID=A0ABU8TRU2_9HYPH